MPSEGKEMKMIDGYISLAETRETATNGGHVLTMKKTLLNKSPT